MWDPFVIVTNQLETIRIQKGKFIMLCRGKVVVEEVFTWVNSKSKLLLNYYTTVAIKRYVYKYNCDTVS